MSFRFLLVMAAIAGGLHAQSMPTYWRMADPDAKVLAGIDLKAVMSSPAAADWKSQLEQATGGTLKLKAMDETGMLTGLLSSIDKVFLSMDEIPSGTAAKPKMAVALQGNFDLAALRKVMTQQGGIKGLYRGVEIWQSGKSNDNVMIALASAQTLAVGDTASVRKAINHFAVGNGSVMDNPIFQRAATLAQGSDIWISGAIPVSPDGKSALPPQAQMLSSVESFDLGLKLHNGLDVEVNLYADKEDSAKHLSSLIQTMVQLTASGQEDQQVTDLLSHLRIGTEGAQLQLVASWTQAELATAAKAFGSPGKGRRKADASGLLAFELPSARPAPESAISPGLLPVKVPKPAPPKPRELKVRIYNPDDNVVKELDLNRQ